MTPLRRPQGTISQNPNCRPPFECAPPPRRFDVIKAPEQISAADQPSSSGTPTAASSAVTPVPASSGSGGLLILAGIGLIAALVFMGGRA